MWTQLKSIGRITLSLVVSIIHVIELSQHLSGRIRLEKRGVPKFLLETSFPWKLRYGARNAQDCASRSSVTGYSTDWKGWLHWFEFGEFESIVDCNRFDWIDCSRRARLPDDSWCYVPRPRDKALHRMIPWPVGRQTRIAVIYLDSAFDRAMDLRHKVRPPKGGDRTHHHVHLAACEMQYKHGL